MHNTLYQDVEYRIIFYSYIYVEYSEYVNHFDGVVEGFDLFGFIGIYIDLVPLYPAAFWLPT
jgi:hypothetical protein